MTLRETERRSAERREDREIDTLGGGTERESREREFHRRVRGAGHERRRWSVGLSIREGRDDMTR